VTEPIQIRSVEAWITRKELASLMGVSVRTVDRLTAAGMPSVTWGSKTRRYRASQAIHWAAAWNGGDNSVPVQPLRRAS
jgi:phage terminase Nu1 subunit (DNA packaging protein)